MGEYATYNGRDVKIGTCENLYYLRADQASEVSPPVTDLGCRFRFPWPDEDARVPGEYDDYDRSYPVWGGAQAPEGLDHYSVQFKADAGYLVSLPCPEGSGARTPGFSTEVGGLTIHRNGFRGAVRLVQQKRLKNGALVPVFECGGCGARYRIETADECAEILEALEQPGRDPEDDSRIKYGRKLASRIRAGFAEARD